MTPGPRDKRKADLIVLGASKGGVKALQTLLAALPAGFPPAVIIVTHRRPSPEDRLTALLEKTSALPVDEAEDKMRILPGHIYLAPAAYHLLVDGGHLALSTDAPVHYARPSVDVLFESAADAYGQGVIGVILTGASEDGAQGLARVKARGGLAMVQDPETADSRIMPEAAIAATNVDKVLPLEGIGPFLVAQYHPRKERPAEPAGISRPTGAVVTAPDIRGRSRRRPQ